MFEKTKLDNTLGGGGRNGSYLKKYVNSGPCKSYSTGTWVSDSNFNSSQTINTFEVSKHLGHL